MIYPVKAPTKAPRQKINKPVLGSSAISKNAASPTVAVKTATKEPKLILP